jgi:hypothetical protein
MGFTKRCNVRDRAGAIRELEFALASFKRANAGEKLSAGEWALIDWGCSGVAFYAKKCSKVAPEFNNMAFRFLVSLDCEESEAVSVTNHMVSLAELFVSRGYCELLHGCKSTYVLTDKGRLFVSHLKASTGWAT